MGGGLIEFLFGDGQNQGGRYQQQPYQQQPSYEQVHAPTGSCRCISGFDPRFEKQLVDYHGSEKPGTIIIDTPNKFLFLVQGNGTAVRYGVGVAVRDSHWSGRQADSPAKEGMAGVDTRRRKCWRGAPTCRGTWKAARRTRSAHARLYLGSSLYRIHGSNEPWTIGTNVSSGCIRMRNEDVIDLYGRVNVGAKVVVI
jgi:lipoprotein-anchoring transpeptidase ErfK/SrfK